MRKVLCMIVLVSLCLVLGVASGVGVYQLGDKVEDFSAVLSDGTEITLYELLETKKAVLLNFWATWCPPCVREFPYLQTAYEGYADQVAVVALSVETMDTDETINAFKQKNGLTLHMGQDKNEINCYFDTIQIPTSVLIDRNGIMCWRHTGSITDARHFQWMFEEFSDEDYSESKVGYVIAPPKRSVPDPQTLNAAAGSVGIELKNADQDGLWAFTVAADGTLTPFNIGNPG